MRAQSEVERARGGSEREGASGERASAGARGVGGMGERGSASLDEKLRVCASASAQASAREGYASAVLDPTRYCGRAPYHYLYHGLSNIGLNPCRSGEANDSTSTCED